MRGTRTVGLAVVTATLVAAGASAAAAPGAAPGGAGRVTYVVDGDTIHVRLGARVEKVRVIGIDTPELPRGCYAVQAKTETARLVAGKVVTLRVDPTQPNRDRYGRLLRHVVLADRTSLGLRLLSGGLAREYTVGSRAYAGQAAFRTAQARAAAAKRNIWSGRCPAAAGSGPAAKPAPARQPVRTSTCAIKGNISSTGERIYHVPGQRDYGATVITLTKGERWFCTEADAVRAGWRRAKR